MTANRESADDEWENLDVPAAVEVPVQAPADADVPVVEAEEVPQTEDTSSDVPN